jgi:hypothetical protein
MSPLARAVIVLAAAAALVLLLVEVLSLSISIGVWLALHATSDGIGPTQVVTGAAFVAMLAMLSRALVLLGQTLGDGADR